LFLLLPLLLVDLGLDQLADAYDPGEDLDFLALPYAASEIAACHALEDLEGLVQVVADVLLGAESVEALWARVSGVVVSGGADGEGDDVEEVKTLNFVPAG
jgi:hypothetical protein